MCHIFFSFFCCVLVGCLVSYCAHFLSLVFSLYYNFFCWKNFISGKLCANIAPQFYSFPQNVLKRHEPKHLANGETNNNLQNGQQFAVTPFSIQAWSQSVEISEISNLFSQPLPQLRGRKPAGQWLPYNHTQSCTNTPFAPLFHLIFLLATSAHVADQGWAGIPVPVHPKNESLWFPFPNYGNGFFHSLPVPKLREWLLDPYRGSDLETAFWLFHLGLSS